MTAFVININGYTVEISQTYHYRELENSWLEVQKNQDLPFFLTWSWISCWIKTYQPEIVVVSAKWDNKVVAIGLFTCSVENRHGFISSRQYRLHQMGDALLDQVWMEYNDFITVSGHRVPAVNACILGLQESDLEWDEIVFSMMTDSRAKDIRKNISNTHILMNNSCYCSDLDSIRRDKKDYLSVLNPNTRYQIRRSIRLYQQLHGEIKYTFARNVGEALTLFHEAGRYHLLRWDDSGFKNEQFILFHENLIRSSLDDNAVNLMKITAGDTTIAILYFHLVAGDVYFYLQGINYESDEKLKPGLVAHALATQYYLDKGMRKYDYMGGYSQYKCQLSDPAESLVTLCVQKPSLSFSVENTGRKVKHLFASVANRLLA
jgi:CelD/BcsL family acetyltransferase involved in cellulose biosynthesis